MGQKYMCLHDEMLGPTLLDKILLRHEVQACEWDLGQKLKKQEIVASRATTQQTIKQQNGAF